MGICQNSYPKFIKKNNLKTKETQKESHAKHESSSYISFIY